MSASPSRIRWHRVLGLFTVLHAVALLVFLRFGVTSLLLFHLWIWLATVWLLWPVVLLFHPGRSITRCLVPILLSLPVFWRFADDYRFMAPSALFGTPEGISLSVSDLRDYLAARREGRAAAERDLRSGILAVEEYGMPKPEEYKDILREQYRVQVRQIAGDTDVTAKVIGHAKGYNEVSKAAIDRRFGEHALTEAEDKAWKNYHDKASK